MENENLQKLNEEYNLIKQQYEEAQKEYKNISSQCDIINAELSLMNCFSNSKEEIAQKEKELKLLKDRLFDIQETMQSLFITKLQKGMELQSKMHPCALKQNNKPITKTLVKQNN